VTPPGKEPQKEKNRKNRKRTEHAGKGSIRTEDSRTENVQRLNKRVNWYEKDREKKKKKTGEIEGRRKTRTQKKATTKNALQQPAQKRTIMKGKKRPPSKEKN